MSFEQAWLVAMWTKIYQQFCLPGDSGAPEWFLSIPDTGGLLPIDEYFLNVPLAATGPDIQRLQGNANFAYATNFIPHFTGASSAYATVWDAYERVFGQIDRRISKFGLPRELVGTPSGERIEQQRQVLLDLLTAPDSKEYRESLLGVPGSLFNPATPWGRVSVRASDVDTVLSQAPTFLKRMFGWDGTVAHGPGSLDVVDEISFEFATATIVRNWLDLDQLLTHLWDWVIPGTPALSNGSNPPGGELPAIPERVVFARNATVKFKASAGAAPDAGQFIARELKFLPFMAASVQPANSPVSSGDSVLLKPWLLSSQTRLELAATPGLEPALATALQGNAVERAAAKPVVLKGISVAQRAAVSVAPLTRAAAVKGASIAQGKASVAALAPGGAAAPRAALLQATRVKLPIDRLERPPIVSSPAPTPPATPPPAPTPAPPAPEGFRAVQILAFLCRPLPELPSPLPNLVYD